MLSCAHCGGTHEIPASPDAALEERPYLATLASLEKDCQLVERVSITCGSCGASVEFADNVTSASCPFCGTPQVASKSSVKAIAPQGILPFAITTDAAKSVYAKWLKGLWWAPNDLVRRATMDGCVQGVYLPFYTYDARSDTRYTGQRGEDYWDTERYTVMVNGRSQTRTRTVRKTRWYPAQGRVGCRFDDVLVIAAGSLPIKRLATLEPWDLKALVPYRDEFVSGFRSETYAVSLADGFKIADVLMQPTIDAAIRRDIGGDRQSISSKRTEYDDVTFKHVLLPVWVSAYRYRGKLYQILINARTGELSGDRPYSWVKISLAVLAAIAVAAVILIVASAQSR